MRDEEWRAVSVAFATFAVCIALASPSARAAAAKPATDLAARRKALDALLKEQWEYTLSTNPEFASILGDRRWNDKLSEVSDAAVQKDLAKTKEFLARFPRYSVDHDRCRRVHMSNVHGWASVPFARA